MGQSVSNFWLSGLPFNSCIRRQVGKRIFAETFWSFFPAVSRSLTGCFRRKIGEVSAGRRGYSYCQKSYEIYPTPLLRNYCFFGLFSISLPQLPAILRGAAGEKEKCDLSYSLKFRSIPTDFLLNLISTYLRQ